MEMPIAQNSEEERTGDTAIAQNSAEEKVRDLYDAAQKGCVSTLNSLLQQDPLILHRLSSRTTLIETPLHISALLGHLEFTRTLLAYCPKLALELDLSRSSPLHLASAQGHIDIVRELLQACGEACLVRNQEHKIPLHHAVIRGRRDVVLELIRAKPDSLKFHADEGKNIFHLCVIHNHLEILKDLVTLDNPDTNNLLIEKDLDGGNTILHLAIMSKQVEIVRYLISIPRIRSKATTLKNERGCTPADMVQLIPKDSNSLEIQVILMDSGIKCGRTEKIGVSSEEEERIGNEKTKKKWWQRNVLKNIDQWLVYNGIRLEDMRGSLSLVAIVIATMTYQAALNPPGSVVQQGIRPSRDRHFNLTSSSNTDITEGPLGCLPYNDKDGHVSPEDVHICPGEAIHGYRHSDYFAAFIIYNTISFVASLCVVFLLVSGIPLNHRIVMWMLSIAMSIALTCLLNAYIIALALITPYSVTIDKFLSYSTYVFNGLHALVGLYLVAVFVRGAVKKLKRKLTQHRRSNDNVANA